MQGENTLWREGFVDLLSSNLDGAGPPPHRSAVRRDAQLEWRRTSSRPSRSGKRTGARFVVLGHVLGAGSRLRARDGVARGRRTGRRAEPIELRDATERHGPDRGLAHAGAARNIG
jgi:hypothetical protein